LLKLYKIVIVNLYDLFLIVNNTLLYQINNVENINTFISWSAKKIQKSLKNNIFAITRLVLQITEHLKRNVQTSIVPFLQNILMQQYWNIFASIV